ncbi:hypothetical protein [Streptomyces sp. NPDC048665]|uniref:hypothetical protein n=1 Tax=Streptomyces sp. NPDC048665 TaxID=3155490 RepID=UPI0034133C97
MGGGAVKIYDASGAGGEAELCHVPALHDGSPIIVDENTFPGLCPDLFHAVGKDFGRELFQLIVQEIRELRFRWGLVSGRQAACPATARRRIRGGPGRAQSLIAEAHGRFEETSLVVLDDLLTTEALDHATAASLKDEHARSFRFEGTNRGDGFVAGLVEETGSLPPPWQRPVPRPCPLRFTRGFAWPEAERPCGPPR